MDGILPLFLSETACRRSAGTAGGLPGRRPSSACVQTKAPKLNYESQNPLRRQAAENSLFPRLGTRAVAEKSQSVLEP